MDQHGTSSPDVNGITVQHAKHLDHNITEDSHADQLTAKRQGVRVIPEDGEFVHDVRQHTTVEASGDQSVRSYVAELYSTPAKEVTGGHDTISAAKERVSTKPY